MAKKVFKNSSPVVSTPANPKNEVAAGAPMIKGVTWGVSKPISAVTAKGQGATNLSKGTHNIPKITGKGDTGAFRGSGASLGQGFALSKPTKPSNVAGAALSAAGVAGAGVAMSRVAVRAVVSEATKKLQRELQSELKTRSGKGMSKLERQGEGEYRSEMEPSEYMEWKNAPSELQKAISKSMKETTKKKIVIKKK